MRIHGGRELKSDKGIDLSVNINPYAPHPDLFENLNLPSIALYPDSTSRRLRERIARDYGVLTDQVVIGNGASELIWAATRAFLREGDRALVLNPTFCEFESAAKQRGVECVVLESEEDFRFCPSKLADRMGKTRPKLLSLCNPNSPSGLYLDVKVIQDLARTYPDILILLDESFLSLSDHHAEVEQRYPRNVVRIVSLTKDHAIPGLRLGYAVGYSALIAAMADELPSWNVNGLAQHVGLFLLGQKDFLATCRERIFADRRALEESLRERRIPFIPSSTCFLMLRGTQTQAERLWTEHEINVRTCASYGLADWWRIAVRPLPIQERFFAALDALKG